jgi:hypothetical protein
MDKGWEGKGLEGSADIVRNLVKELNKLFEEKTI